MDDACAALIASLELAPHPEGGFYRETFRSPQRLDGLPHGAPRAASTAIYFLLPPGEFSAFHAVASDEVFHHYDGAPLALELLHADGRHERLMLGRDVARGQRPQGVVPAGVLQACAPSGGGWSLVGCTVAPGFDFADFVMPSREALLARFPAHAALITARTRAAI
ncbi:MAG: cupin domain-containing protein [Polyangiaceae bacterium]|nr:cupin domain-containing protein [Polyangiaceae bacterium]